ncbi:Acg family FMN-binding oxidoreductase [Nocardia sp. NPDC051321]|uniref:Acg family FMN-binding oxidoreductase n=1 Tax=Nocardia sp. NPDC051321 TaxID=3364323 RepID=UPI0037B1FC0C
MNALGPDSDTLRAALRLAARAPSIHNTQPWRWERRFDTIDLYADPDRQLIVCDRQRQQLEISCGVALHHLRAAFLGLGWASQVQRLPDAGDSNHLARLSLRPRSARGIDRSLAAAIPLRHTDRRRFLRRPVPAGYLSAISICAEKYGQAEVHRIRVVDQSQLGELMWSAVRRHAADPGYQAELAAWSGRLVDDHGVPAGNAVPVGGGDAIPRRAFAAPACAEFSAQSDGAEWLAVCTTTDCQLARIRAGETLSALLLSATHLGLATGVQTEPLELPEIRDRIRISICDGHHPHTMVRIGWTPGCAAPIPLTQRRGNDELLRLALGTS